MFLLWLGSAVPEQIKVVINVVFLHGSWHCPKAQISSWKQFVDTSMRNWEHISHWSSILLSPTWQSLCCGFIIIVIVITRCFNSGSSIYNPWFPYMLYLSFPMMFHSVRLVVNRCRTIFVQYASRWIRQQLLGKPRLSLVSLKKCVWGLMCWIVVPAFTKHRVWWMCCMFGVMVVDRVANPMSRSRDNIILRRGGLSSYVRC